MSKQQDKQNQFTIYVEGQAVPVSEEVYRVYHHYERKEEYFSCDRKRGKFQQDTGTSCPLERIPTTGFWSKTSNSPARMFPQRIRRFLRFG